MNMNMNMKQYKIDSELSRTYYYSNGESFTIDAPETLYVKVDENGESHRVVTKDSTVFWVRRDWIAISWIPENIANPVQF